LSSGLQNLAQYIHGLSKRFQNQSRLKRESSRNLAAIKKKPPPLNRPERTPDKQHRQADCYHESRSGNRAVKHSMECKHFLHHRISFHLSTP
jgi:hypothetical protein